jgi:multiple sugar transport system substrate-binding protein
VRTVTYTWSDGLDQLLHTALHGEGPDVSEIGTTWVSSFMAMNSLQPFASAELRTIGSRNSFLPATWQSGLVEGGEQLWAVPWMVGMRVFFYRKDLFDKAGLDPQTAFETHDVLDHTLATLQESGIPSPWGVPTLPTINTLHYISNWIWSAGGDFVSEDGKKVLFDTPESLAGIKKYFELGRFLPQPAEELDFETIGDLFWRQGKVAVTIGGPWQLPAYEDIADPKVWNNLGIAPLPGIVFLGGSNLVIWEHVRNKTAAVRLVGFLTGNTVQQVYPSHCGLYPVRRETVTRPPFIEDSLYQMLAPRFETGRSYPAVSLWGIIERRLPHTLSDIWQAYLKEPASDLDNLIHKHIDRQAHRLAITLQR